MDIQTQTAAAGAFANSAANAAVIAVDTPERKDPASALSSDFETFLLMLTTQMQNQDPLNPIESQDFAVQLATFSGVEQQVRTNELLESLSTGMGLSGMSQLAGWVGMEARVDAPVFFDGAPVTLAPSPDAASDAAILVVKDATGRVVSREAIPLGQPTLQWAGVGNDGTPLPPGLYTLDLESFNQGQITGTTPVEHYAVVREARQGTSGIEIVMPGGVSVPASSATALRTPGSLP